MKGHVSITDFRSFDQIPTGNRFLVYSLFPESSVNLKIHYDNNNKENIAVHVGHSIFNRNCDVSIGRMLSAFGGGGHHGAGGTMLHIKEADRSIDMILDILLSNEG
jgi:nanoRNase/pAp phosphatase (c-di-AMP/oligoRNAs hydrolase)